MQKKSFKESLAEILKYKGMSQSDLANITGITASSISDWLNGKYEPKQDKIYIISKTL